MDKLSERIFMQIQNLYLRGNGKLKNYEINGE